LREELNGHWRFSLFGAKQKNYDKNHEENPTLTDKFSNNFCKEFCFSCKEISSLVLCSMEWNKRSKPKQADFYYGLIYTFAIEKKHAKVERFSIQCRK